MRVPPPPGSTYGKSASARCTLDAPATSKREGVGTGGPTTDTTVPPARIRPADASRCAADDIESQVDAADVLQGVVLEVDELLRAEVERRLTVGSASGADDVGAGLTCELRHGSGASRPDRA